MPGTTIKYEPKWRGQAPFRLRLREVEMREASNWTDRRVTVNGGLD